MLEGGIMRKIVFGAIVALVMVPGVALAQQKSCSSLAQFCNRICSDPKRNCTPGECEGYRQSCKASKSGGFCVWRSANNITPGVSCS